MSEPTMPFGADPDSPFAVEDPPNPDHRRKLLLAAGGGLVVLALAAKFLLLPGGDVADDLAFTPTPRVPVASPSASPAADAAVPATFDDVLGHDPFDPLVVMPAPAAPSPVAAVKPTPTPSPTPASVPTVIVVPPSEQLTGPVTLRVLDLYTTASQQRVRATLDGQVYDVAANEVFGGRFALTAATSETCGTFSYGEEPADLCEGESRTFG